MINRNIHPVDGVPLKNIFTPGWQKVIMCLVAWVLEPLCLPKFWLIIDPSLNKKYSITSLYMYYSVQLGF